MPTMTLAGAVVAHLALGFGWISALLLGAILAPTDPILGRSVVTGFLARRNLPERLRSLLLAEAGANDGLAFPLVMLPIVIGNRNDGLFQWLVHALLYQAPLAGWFGPIGVGALFYAALAQRDAVPSGPWNAASLVVAASVVAYAATSSALVVRFGRPTRTRNAEIT